MRSPCGAAVSGFLLLLRVRGDLSQITDCTWDKAPGRKCDAVVADFDSLDLDSGGCQAIFYGNNEGVGRSVSYRESGSKCSICDAAGRTGDDDWDWWECVVSECADGYVPSETRRDCVFAPTPAPSVTPVPTALPTTAAPSATPSVSPLPSSLPTVSPLPSSVPSAVPFPTPTRPRSRVLRCDWLKDREAQCRDVAVNLDFLDVDKQGCKQAFLDYAEEVGENVHLAYRESGTKCRICEGGPIRSSADDHWLTWRCLVRECEVGYLPNSVATACLLEGAPDNSAASSSKKQSDDDDDDLALALSLAFVCLILSVAAIIWAYRRGLLFDEKLLLIFWRRKRWESQWDPEIIAAKQPCLLSDVVTGTGPPPEGDVEENDHLELTGTATTGLNSEQRERLRLSMRP